nr:hypothetical protein CFP56_51896 [Quercus suber]
MDDDEGSDDEVENLREGFAAIRFSKGFKQQIRNPWARALIVKVYGKEVGFSFLQAKLLSLWKLAGRLDCVRLGFGFFLVRLSLREDYENVLKKGPWFIGRSIGSMLRIDMYMAEESRARFAHLCVQIDVDKPLITTILIVKLQQPESLDKEETIDTSDKACDLHEADTTRTEAGPSSSMQEEANRNVQEDQYRPWVMVTHKRNGTKTQRSGGPR